MPPIIVIRVEVLAICYQQPQHLDLCDQKENNFEYDLHHKYDTNDQNRIIGVEETKNLPLVTDDQSLSITHYYLLTRPLHILTLNSLIPIILYQISQIPLQKNPRLMYQMINHLTIIPMQKLLIWKKLSAISASTKPTFDVNA